MSNRRKLAQDYRAPLRTHGRGRHRQPSRSVGDLVAVPGQAGAKLLAAGALGSAALIAVPVGGGAATAMETSSGAASQAASLTADVQARPAATQQGPIFLVPKTPPTATNPFITLVPSTTPQPLPPNPEFVLPNGKITSDPAAASAAALPPAQPQLSPDQIAALQSALDGSTAPPVSSPMTPTGPTPITVYGNFARGIGGMFSYTTDPSGQTDGTVSAGVLLGWAANAGVRIGTPAPQGFDVSVPITAILGPATASATWDITNSSVSLSGSVDGASRPLPGGGSTGWSIGGTYIVNSDGSWTLLPRGSIWGSVDPLPQFTIGLAVSAPLPKDFVSTSVQAIADAATYEAGLIPPQLQPQAAPDQPTAGTPTPTPGGATIDQQMLPVAPSQGFPDPTSSNANSGLAWLAQQPPSAGPTFQDIMNAYSQVPGTLPAGSFPPAPAPAPTPEQHGQADQPPSTDVAAAPDANSPTNNGASGTVVTAAAGPQAPAPAAAPTPAPANDTNGNTTTSTTATAPGTGTAAPITVTDSGTGTTDTNQQPASGTQQTDGTGVVQTASAQPDTSQPDTSQQDNSNTMVTVADPTGPTTTLAG